MILTNCAACAAPLAHNAPRCVRCWTRYEIRDELALVLDEDAQTMVVKLWRVLLFHAAKAAQRPSA